MFLSSHPSLVNVDSIVCVKDLSCYECKEEDSDFHSEHTFETGVDESGVVINLMHRARVIYLEGSGGCALRRTNNRISYCESG